MAEVPPSSGLFGVLEADEHADEEALASVGSMLRVVVHLRAFQLGLKYSNYLSIVQCTRVLQVPPYSGDGSLDSVMGCGGDSRYKALQLRVLGYRFWTLLSSRRFKKDP